MSLREFTPARVDLGRAGCSLTTRDYLDFQLAHARARDAVHFPFDAKSVAAEIEHLGLRAVTLKTEARDRAEFLRRPDLGRRLSTDSAAKLEPPDGKFDIALVIADGLSAMAAQRHAVPFTKECLTFLSGGAYNLAPVTVVENGRVAISDEIGSRLGAALAIILIGERPGLSSVDSLGVYLTWSPRPGRTDAERNCISNVRPAGLDLPVAAQALQMLVASSLTGRLSGIGLRIPTALL